MDDCTSFELDAVQRRQTPPYGAVQPGITVARPARRAADTVAVPLLANLSSETRMATRNRPAPRDVAREAGRGHERGGGPAVGRPLDAPAPAPDHDRAWCPSASDTVPSPPGALPRELEAPSVGGETAQLATHTRTRASRAEAGAPPLRHEWCVQLAATVSAADRSHFMAAAAEAAAVAVSSPHPECARFPPPTLGHFPSLASVLSRDAAVVVT